MTRKISLPKLLTYAIHIIAWVLVFCFPLILSGRDSSQEFQWKEYLIHSVFPLVFMLLFYTNTVIYIPRLLFKNKSFLFILTNIITIIILSFALNLWRTNIIRPKDSTYTLKHSPQEQIYNMEKENSLDAKFESGKPQFRPPRFKNDLFNKWWIFVTDAFSMLFIVGLAATIKMTERWSMTERSLRIAQEKKTEAELDNLRNQLNPHFLLNTLNNIYALIAIDSNKAQDAVHKLSKLLRHMLYEKNDQYIPITEEMDFLNNYIELMRIRLAGNCKLSINFNVKDNCKTTIAPLIFISLIENAFKHGVSPSEESFIDVFLKEDNGKIICKIENSFFPKSKNDKSGSGIGLAQVKARLDLMYNGKYKWEYGQRENTYISYLELN
jgi:Putative regulator of cell autolysis